MCIFPWVGHHIFAFLYIITNSFASVYHIPTNLGTKMHPYTAFICTKLDNTFALYGNFHTLMKEEGKNEETKLIFESLYLENEWKDLF